LYGPFRYTGKYTSPSNAAFDRMLMNRDGNSGIRDIEAVTNLAADVGLKLVTDREMPAFNRFLVFVREA